MKKIAIIALIVFLATMVLACAVCVVLPPMLVPSGNDLPYDPVTRASELVAVGDSREEAVELLAADAWYYQPCGVGENFATDLFFYGSHGYDSAKIVIVDSEAQDGELKVTKISSAEPYIWQTYYSKCIDEERFEYGLYERFNDTFWFLAP